jgi:hypothetical protein
VTVCVAAECRSLNKLVFVSDELISSEWASTEGAWKIDMISSAGPWMAMFAGHAPTFVQVVAALRQLLGKTAGMVTAKTIGEVITACSKVHADQLQKRIEMEILLPYGITREEFVEKGSVGSVRGGLVCCWTR